MKLEGKKALITGGNSGIGFATARLFIHEGAEVAITGRDQQTLDAAVEALGTKAVAYRADVTDSNARADLFSKIGQRFGSLDIIFANAGIAGATPIGSADEAVFENIIRVNLTSVFFTVQAALPLLNDGSSIILNSSVIGSLGNPGRAAYAARRVFAAWRERSHMNFLPATFESMSSHREQSKLPSGAVGLLHLRRRTN